MNKWRDFRLKKQNWEKKTEDQNTKIIQLEKSGIQKADELVHLKEQIGSLQLSLEGENRRFTNAKADRDRLQRELELAHKSLLEKDDATKHIESLLNDTLTRDQIRKEDKGILEKNDVG